VALQQATGAKWEYVPYKGGSQAIQDTVAGQCQVMMNGMLATLPHVQSGKLKLLGVSKGTRMPLIGNVPTIAEQGVPGYETGTWQGVLAPRGTPEAIVQKLNTELVRAIRNPETRAKLAGQGAEIVTMAPAEDDRFFEKERARWAKVVNAAGIRAE
jgi:tripartite-type tricarboxylate transporter receptor subunit TctC